MDGSQSAKPIHGRELVVASDRPNGRLAVDLDEVDVPPLTVPVKVPEGTRHGYEGDECTLLKITHDRPLARRERTFAAQTADLGNGILRGADRDEAFYDFNCGFA
jgi:hypothetical protein